MSILDKLFGGKSAPVCRIEHPDGGVLEIRTSGNIDLGCGEDYCIATANYKLDNFSSNMESYSKYFSKPNPLSGEE